MSEIKSTTLFVELDSHKDSISVAYAPEGCADPPIFLGSIGTRQATANSVVRRRQSKAERQVFAYEAGPCGYGLHRYLTAKRPARPCQLDAPATRPPPSWANLDVELRATRPRPIQPCHARRRRTDTGEPAPREKGAPGIQEGDDLTLETSADDEVLAQHGDGRPMQRQCSLGGCSLLRAETALGPTV
jgi:hypothetical protein